MFLWWSIALTTEGGATSLFRSRAAISGHTAANALAAQMGELSHSARNPAACIASKTTWGTAALARS